jgi:hypothetical protein
MGGGERAAEVQKSDFWDSGFGDVNGLIRAKCDRHWVFQATARRSS